MDCRLAIKANSNTSCLDVVLFAYCLKDKERANDSCQFAAVGTLSIVGTGDSIDGDDVGGVVMSTKNGA